HSLDHAGTIAEVEEHHLALIAADIHPALDEDGLTDLLRKFSDQCALKRGVWLLHIGSKIARSAPNTNGRDESVPAEFLAPNDLISKVRGASCGARPRFRRACRPSSWVSRTGARYRWTARGSEHAGRLRIRAWPCNSGKRFLSPCRRRSAA